MLKVALLPWHMAALLALMVGSKDGYTMILSTTTHPAASVTETWYVPALGMLTVFVFAVKEPGPDQLYDGVPDAAPETFAVS